MWRAPERPSEPLAWSSGSVLRRPNYWPRSENPPPKREHESRLSWIFLDGGKSKNSLSDQDAAALQNWVISKTRQADAHREKSLHRNPAGFGADRCAMRGTRQRNSSKMARKLPQNRGPRNASVGRGNRGTMLRCFLAFLARLERAAGQAGSTAALPQISRVEQIKTPFPRTQRRSLGRAALHNALRRLNLAGERSSIGPITPEKIRAAFLWKDPL